MIEKRASPIKLKVIKPADIVHVARLFFTIYEELLVKHQEKTKEKGTFIGAHPEISFHISTNDGIEYSSDSLELFQPDGIVFDKIVSGFSFDVRYYLMNIDVSLSISSGKYPRGEIEVKGNDSNWVALTFQKLNDLITPWENQDTKIKRYRWPISVLLLVMSGWIVGTITFFIVNSFVTNMKPNSIFIFIMISCWAFLGIFVFFLPDYFDSLFPNIEIVPGQEHMRTLSKKRSYLKYIFTAVIIPFIIAFITSLIF